MSNTKHASVCLAELHGFSLLLEQKFPLPVAQNFSLPVFLTGVLIFWSTKKFLMLSASENASVSTEVSCRIDIKGVPWMLLSKTT